MRAGRAASRHRFGGSAMVRIGAMAEADMPALGRLHVDGNDQGRGVRTGLIDTVLAPHAGMPAIALDVLEGNDRAPDFDHRRGFAVVERLAASNDAPGHASFILLRPLPWN